jgi:hypothetical protein
MLVCRVQNGDKLPIRSFLLQALVYAGVTLVYSLVVFHVLGKWLYELYSHNRGLYAWVALGLIVGQALSLEFFARLLFQLIHVELEE